MSIVFSLSPEPLVRYRGFPRVCDLFPRVFDLVCIPRVVLIVPVSSKLVFTSCPDSSIYKKTTQKKKNKQNKYNNHNVFILSVLQLN